MFLLFKYFLAKVNNYYYLCGCYYKMGLAAKKHFISIILILNANI